MFSQYAKYSTNPHLVKTWIAPSYRVVDFQIPLIAWLLSCDISDSLHFRPFCRIASQRPTLGWSAISWIWVTTSKRGTWNASATRKSLTRTSSPTTATLPSTFDLLVLWSLWNRCWSYRNALMWLFEISVYPHLFTFSVLPPLYFLSRAFFTVWNTPSVII